MQTFKCKMCGSDYLEKEHGNYCSVECQTLDISIYKYLKNKKKKEKQLAKQEIICSIKN